MFFETDLKVEKLGLYKLLLKMVSGKYLFEKMLCFELSDFFSSEFTPTVLLPAPNLPLYDKYFVKILLAPLQPDHLQNLELIR